MERHHLIISGTGRAGTTLLVQLFTQLGLDTGFTDTTSSVYDNCNGGMESDLRQPDAPYVVKSPWLCDYLDDVLQNGDTVIDHAIIPVRDLYSAAQSRRDVTEKTDPDEYPTPDIPGGLWHTENPDEQETILAKQFYKLLFVIAKHDIPMTLVHFPRFAYEPAYLYWKIAPLLGDIGYGTFMTAFGEVGRPELVHNFVGSVDRDVGASSLGG